MHWMLGGAFFFAIMGSFVKACHRLPTAEISFFRGLVNVLVFLPWFLKNPFWREFKREPVFLFLRGMFGWISLFLNFYAIGKLALGDAMMLTYSSPLLVLLFSRIFLKEKLSVLALPFVGLAFAGVALILKPGLDVNSLAGLAGLCSAVTAACSYLTVKIATRKVGADYIVFTFAVVITLASAIPMAFAYQHPLPKEWLYLCCAGVSATIAQKMMTRGYAALPASVASPLLLSTAAFAGLLGLIIWREIPDLYSIVGAVFLAVGLTLSYRYRNVAY